MDMTDVVKCKEFARRAKRAVEKAFPMGTQVRFPLYPGRPVVGEVSGCGFHRTTGEPILFVLFEQESGPRLIADVPPRKAKVVR